MRSVLSLSQSRASNSKAAGWAGWGWEASRLDNLALASSVSVPLSRVWQYASVATSVLSSTFHLHANTGLGLIHI